MYECELSLGLAYYLEATGSLFLVTHFFGILWLEPLSMVGNPEF